eukprot:gnl/Chilomastix_cuspidata/3951.p1 GENE.gnl/Chilomastix_cuspidata/3951~~gnl/Chilomastix_cuspidata/3951.p1  ORF type:complete len:529 (-),score=128.70 gnl/Chilomastix_cuspidata/3951:205-1791(-)
MPDQYESRLHIEFKPYNDFSLPMLGYSSTKTNKIPTHHFKRHTTNLPSKDCPKHILIDNFHSSPRRMSGSTSEFARTPDYQAQEPTLPDIASHTGNPLLCSRKQKSISDISFHCRELAGCHQRQQSESSLYALKCFAEETVAAVCAKKDLPVIFRSKTIGARVKLHVAIASMPPVLLTLNKDLSLHLTCLGTQLQCRTPFVEFRNAFKRFLADITRAHTLPNSPLSSRTPSEEFLPFQSAPLRVQAPVAQSFRNSDLLCELRNDAKKLRRLVKNFAKRHGLEAHFREEAGGVPDSFSPREATLQLEAQLLKQLRPHFSFTVTFRPQHFSFASSPRIFFSQRSLRLFETSILTVLDQCLACTTCSAFLSPEDLLFHYSGAEQNGEPNGASFDSSPELEMTLDLSDSPLSDAASLRSCPISPLSTRPPSETLSDEDQIVSTVNYIADVVGIDVQSRRVEHENGRGLVFFLPSARGNESLFDVKVKDSMYVLFHKARRVHFSFDISNFLSSLRNFAETVLRASKQLGQQLP